MAIADKVLLTTIFGFGLAWLVSIPIGEYFRFRLLRRLREFHADVWKTLGEPTFWWNASPRNSLLTLGWVLKGGFACLDDPEARSLGRRVRIATVLQVGVPVLFILASLVSAVLARLAA